MLALLAHLTARVLLIASSLGKRQVYSPPGMVIHCLELISLLKWWINMI